MNGYNRVIIAGNVGKDAEVKTLEGGASVATATIAVNDSYTDRTSGERKTTVEWIRVEAWRSLADFLGKYGKKGTNFLVEGKIKTDSWEKDGQTHYSTKVVADKIMFLSPKGNEGNTQNNGNQQAAAPQVATAQASTAQASTPQMHTAQTTGQEFISGMASNDGDDLPF